MDKTKGNKEMKSFYQKEALGPRAPWPFSEGVQMNSFIQNKQGGLQSVIIKDIAPNLEMKFSMEWCGGSGLLKAPLSLGPLTTDTIV